MPPILQASGPETMDVDDITVLTEAAADGDEGGSVSGGSTVKSAASKVGLGIVRGASRSNVSNASAVSASSRKSVRSKTASELAGTTSDALADTIASKAEEREGGEEEAAAEREGEGGREVEGSLPFPTEAVIQEDEEASAEELSVRTGRSARSARSTLSAKSSRSVRSVKSVRSARSTASARCGRSTKSAKSTASNATFHTQTDDAGNVEVFEVPSVSTADVGASEADEQPTDEKKSREERKEELRSEARALVREVFAESPSVARKEGKLLEEYEGREDLLVEHLRRLLSERRGEPEKEGDETR